MMSKERVKIEQMGHQHRTHILNKGTLEQFASRTVYFPWGPTSVLFCCSFFSLQHQLAPACKEVTSSSNTVGGPIVWPRSQKDPQLNLFSSILFGGRRVPHCAHILTQTVQVSLPPLAHGLTGFWGHWTQGYTGYGLLLVGWWVYPLMISQP